MTEEQTEIAVTQILLEGKINRDSGSKTDRWVVEQFVDSQDATTILYHVYNALWPIAKTHEEGNG